VATLHMIDGSSFLGLFTLELIGQAFFRSAGKGIRISLPAFAGQPSIMLLLRQNDV
jgi:hypothetical protein